MSDRARLAVAAVKGLVVGVLTVGAALLAPRLYRANRSWICASGDDSAMCGAELEGLRVLAIIIVGTAVVVGPLLAWALRLRLPFLYAIPVLCGCWVSDASPWLWFVTVALLHAVLAVVVTSMLPDTRAPAADNTR